MATLGHVEAVIIIITNSCDWLREFLTISVARTTNSTISQRITHNAAVRLSDWFMRYCPVGRATNGIAFYLDCMFIEIYKGEMLKM